MATPTADAVVMAEDRTSRPGGTEQPIPPRDIDPSGSSRGVDDHQVTPHPRGIGHQPTTDLDDGVDAEHLSSSSQGARPEDAADPDREPPPRG